MEKKYSLTYPEQSIYLTEQFYKNNNINSICGTAIVESKLDFDVLKKAINYVVFKNDSFRIHLTAQKEEVKQYIADYKEFDVEIIDIAGKEDVAVIENNLLQRHFNLFDNDLFEFKIFRFTNGNGGFLLNIHHIISDAWTLGLTCRKIMNVYSNLVDFETLHDVGSSYIDYIEDENKYINSEKFLKDKAYWDKLLKDTPTPADLPSDINSKDSDLSCVGDRLSFLVSKQKMRKITDFCNNNKISNFAFLMAVYSIYIGRISNLDNFCLGTSILNRVGNTQKNTTGMFVNVSPFKVSLNENTSFLNFVNGVGSNILSLLRHQKYPYKLMLEELRKQDPATPNLYNIVLSYQLTKANNESNYKYTTRWAFNGTEADGLTIQFYDLDEDGILNIAYDFKKLKYSSDYIKNMHSRIMEIIDQVLENPEIDLNSIDIVTKKERKTLLEDFNNTELKYNKNKNVVNTFQAMAKKYKNKPAICFEDSSITYSELNKKANILAHYLIKQGICPKDIVGIMLNRSIELAVGILAIAKIGACYLPIDPEYPKDRISYMLEDSKAKAILVNDKTKSIISEKAINISFSEDLYKSKKTLNLIQKISPEDLIYLIYTSGSTGKPKGVMLKHKNITNFLLGAKKVIDFSFDKVMVSITTVCFDIFVLEFWGSLTSGMTLVIANEYEQNSAKALNKLCRKYLVNMIQTTPSRFSEFITDNKNIGFLKIMKDIMVGGEPISYSLLESLSNLTRANIYNMYGPTETAVWSTIKKLSLDSPITIGKPIANTKCYVLDKNMNLLPPQIPGELYIGGDGVSNGYLNRESLTTEKFVPSPFEENYTIYDTNDLAYFTENGEIVHLGRTDFQVKLRGYRIELNEIENKVISLPEISNAVVVVDSTQKYLICYYTQKEEIDEAKISNYLLKELPTYMVPAYYCKLDSFPLTPNGKLDKKKLPNPKIKEEKIEKYSTKTEKLIYDVIAEILDKKELDINTPFISLGLDSLGIIQAQTKLLGYKYVLNTQDFYRFNTIKSLAENIDTNIYTYKEKDTQVPVQFRHKFDEILSKIDKKEISNRILGNVFLTGANGSIGIHVLNELLKAKVKVYCLVRGGSIAESTERLKERYNFYFGKDISHLIGKKIFILNGNISKENIGLSNQNIDLIKEDVSTIIHTAAIVKHYGNYEQFNNVNVIGTKNICDLAFNLGKRLIHISSISVSGNYLVKQDNRNTKFSENNLYIGQNYNDNVYVHSKFEAEKIVLEYMEKGLTAQIHRVGILSGRYSDGVFQENISENAFYSRIKSMITLGEVADTMVDQEIEFTPIDICARNIVKLAKNSIADNKIYHLYNDNFIKISDIIQVLNSTGFDIKIVSNEEFKNRILEISNSENSKDLLGIINDFDYSNKKNISINYNFSVAITCEYTKKYLHLLKCDWNETSKNYIRKLILYMKKVNFI